MTDHGQMKMIAAVVLLSLASFPLRADAGAEIEEFARKAMREIGTAPGLTVVVVQDDRVVYRGDFGLRDVDSKLPVTPDTRFYLASTTKAFTALAAAILADEGKLDLDAPVAAAWPELKLTAPLDPKNLSLRDLLAMRSGLGNDTVNFRLEIGNIGGEAELLRILATYSRQDPRTFRYSNLNYILAGRVLEKLTGRAWSALVAEKILEPLAMSSTITDRVPAGTPVVTCYRPSATQVFVPVPPEIDDAGPAGAMLTTSTDAAKWLLAMLSEGRVGGNQVLPKRAVRIVQSAQTTNKRRYRYFDRYAWGLGQDLAEYEGDLLVHRFGGLNGAYSHVSFMPEHGIGVAAFSNGGGAVPDAVAAFAYDLLLGKKDLAAKWRVELAKVAEAVAAERDRLRKAEATTVAARRDPAHPLSAYAGTYYYDRLGTIIVTTEGGRGFGQFGNFRAELVPTGGDDFLVDWIGQGEPASIKFVFEGPQHPKRIDWGGRIFERVP